MPNELTPAQVALVRADFRRALEHSIAIDQWRQLRLFDDSDEDFIHKEVERKLYEPTLPNGGNLERGYVKRLKKIADGKNWAEGSEKAWVMMQAWQKVLPDNPVNAGWYYVRRPLKRSQDKEEYDWLVTLRNAAREAKEWDKQWLAQMALDGIPEPVANFEIECLFLLRMKDGNVSRLVRLRNVVGETTGIVVLDPEAFHAPQKFRLWCLAHGNYNWGAGEKELNRLHNDIGRLAAWRVINSVVQMGWLPLEERVAPDRLELDGIWFNGDCAYGNTQDKIELLKADDDGIYWHRHLDADGKLVEEGYLVADEGRENAFFQKKPNLHPQSKITAAKLELQPHPEIGFASTENMEGWLEDTENDLLRVFFRELCARMKKAVGTQEANLLVGSFMSFAAAPEIFAKFSLFPGLWVHGEANSGKSTVCEWLMEIYGYSIYGGGLTLKGNSTSAVGLLQAADQYSNHPMWLDEFKNDKVVGPEKLGVIHNAYNRGGQAKFNPSRIQRVMRTNFIISGEATTSESATRGRFPHVQMSKHQREGSQEEQKANKDWFDRHRKYFYFFGRFLMERRREFVKYVLEGMDSWSREDIDSRLRLTHGVGYASWLAMVRLLQSHTGEEVQLFRNYMVAHSKSAQTDVQSDLNVNVFIEDLITAWNAGQMPPEVFRVESEHCTHPPDAPEQTTGWYAYTLWIEPYGAIVALQIFLRKAGREVSLNQKDIRDQLKANDFFVRAEKGKKLNKRFGKPGQTSVAPAWGINADKHKLGYQRCSEEDISYFLVHQEEGDPRKGPLYALIHGVENKQREWTREARADAQADEEAGR